MKQLTMRSWAVLFALTLAVPAARAQQKTATPASPIPPLNSAESSSKGKSAAADNTTAQDPTSDTKPDTHPLSGAEKYSLGSTGRAHSYLLPTFQISENGDTNPTNAGGSGTVHAVTVLTGRLSLQRVWSHYLLSTDYLVGGAIDNTASGLNSSFHQLSLSQSVAGRRWSLLLSDVFSYSPDTSYGFGGGLGSPLPFSATQFGSLGTYSLNLNPGLVPSQSIYTGRARRFNEGVVGSLSYLISPRASATFTGNFGLLHFLDPGYLNSKNYGFQAGYDYAMTAKDTISVSYGVSFFRYGTAGNNFVGHSARVAYGRRVTGRLALQIAVGPQINRSSSPSSTSATVTSWSLLASLRHHSRSSDLDISYNHYTTAGGGVYFGAYSDEVRLTDSIPLGRRWMSSVSTAFANNRSFELISTASTAARFRTWSGGGALSHQFSHYSNLFLDYHAQWQSSGACASTVCTTSFLRHVFGVGLSFNFRPINLD